jgi:hypothetical protein
MGSSASTSDRAPPTDALRSIEVDPYRTQPPPPRPTYALGSVRARRLKLLGAFAAIALSVLLFVRWAGSGGDQVSVVVMMPALFGVMLLQQARFGTIELHPEERVGLVAVRRLGRTKRTRFEYADVVGTRIERVPFLGKPADFELGLTLESERVIPLLRASREPELRGVQRELEAFLTENGLPEARETPKHDSATERSRHAAPRLRSSDGERGGRLPP